MSDHQQPTQTQKPSANSANSTHPCAPTIARAGRRKAAEACERCREKRIKCNGLLPCDQCTKKEFQCVFAFAPLVAPGAGNHEVLAEKLDLVLSRLERLEQRMSCQANSAVASSPRSAALRSRFLPPASQERGIAHLNQQTSCFEYY
ncbi:hypothetical protein C8A05DRAFT_39927, partial [Staphylotrichum tortipilum]